MIMKWAKAMSWATHGAGTKVHGAAARDLVLAHTLIVSIVGDSDCYWIAISFVFLGLYLGSTHRTAFAGVSAGFVGSSEVRNQDRDVSRAPPEFQ